jgi:amino acid adenylation domain-containing protein
MSVSDRIAALTPEQRALFEALRARQEKKPAARPHHQPPPVTRRSGPTGEGDWPLSFDQERLWFLYQLNPTNTAYNVDAASRLRGPLDMPVILACLNEIVRRHGAWRTTFNVVDGQPVQRVVAHREQLLSLVDLSGLPEAIREETMRDVLYEATRGWFDLENGPLVRTTLVRLDERDHVCLLAIHHLVTDWITFHIFFRELALLYEAGRQGRPSPLPEPPVHFSDYALWQREWVRGDVLRDQLDYWLETLDGFPQVLELPTDRPRPPIQRGFGDRRMIDTGRERGERLRTLARQAGATPFIGVLAFVNILFHRLSGQDRIILGSNTANRNRPEIEPVIGFFLTQLLFPIDLSGDPTVRELLARVRKAALGAYANQDLPFGKLVEALRPERDTSRAPLVQSLVLVLDGQYTRTEVAGLSFEPISVFDANARYDMMFGVYDYPDGFYGPLEFDADLWDPATVERLVELLYLMIDEAAADPDRRLSELPALSAAARHQVLVEWNDAAAPVPGAPALRLFEERARERPDAVALQGMGESLTYRELAARAESLARHLRRSGVSPGDLVAVQLERSPDLVPALLGVWKAGAAYLPIDPAYPEERIAYLLEDSGASFVLDRESFLAGDGDEPLPGISSAEDRAYVLYTSGSTGKPKGVEVSHGALANFLASMAALHGAGPEDTVLAVTTISFDIAALELYLPLTTGGRIALADRETAADGALLARAIEESGATLLQATPATWRMLLDSGWPRQTAARPGLRLLCGGEALPRDLADRLLPAGRELWNQYGPTETTVWSATGRVEPGVGSVPLGRPLANTSIHVLDRNLRPVPLGAPGEVWIGGAGVARGYLGRPDLSADRFRPDPFGGSGARLYRTGDLGRHRADGTLDYLGRIDHQVKLRGHRIELGEIEAHLRLHPAVAEAAVLLREERAGDARLVAYVVPRDGQAPEPGDLRAFLQGRLPEFMIPGAAVALDALPLTASGKVDRRALSRIAPDPAAGAGGGVAPRTPEEELLAGIWSRVLGLSEVGVFDDFFTLGGHSLLATQVVMEMRDTFGVTLPVRSVFQAPTIAAQAGLLAAARSEEAGAPASGPIPPAPRAGSIPLSFAQERLWFLDRLTPGGAAYNLPLALRVRGPLDPAALERAFAEAARRHEMLRTAFVERGGRPEQVIAPPDGWSLPVLDLSDSLDPEAGARRMIAAEAAFPFDLARGPLLRASLLRLDDDEHVLLLTVHHIAADLWSLGVLVRELAALYAGSPLPELPVQYADFAVWQRGWLEGEALERQLAFWRERLAGAPPFLELPTDRPRPAAQSLRGATLPFSAGPELAGALAEFGRQRGATAFMTLTAALAVLFGRLANQDDVVLGAPIANRQRPELAGLIGMFVNTLAFRVPLAGSPAFSELLARVRSLALDAFAHQDVPFERLVEDLNPRRDLSRHPVFQVVLAMQNVPVGKLELPGGLVFEPLAVDSAATKFDLTFTLREEGGDLTGGIEYASDLFDAATVRRMAGHLRTLLAGLAASPESPVSELPLLSAEERRQILVDWNQTAAEFPREATLHELFAEQAARTPEAVAVVDGDFELTYGELARRAGFLARRLRAAGVGPESRVALATERSAGMIVGLLAILEAGGAYLPLDLGHPGERLAWMIRDAGASVLLTERRLQESLPAGLEALAVVALDDPGSGGEKGAPPAVPADSLAYVMYTSGSTGAPKGVSVTHRNVVRLVRGNNFADLGPGQAWLQLAPVSFDAATLEIWAPLLNGGRLVLFPGQRPSLDAVAEVIARHGVTSLWVTTGLFHQLVDHRLEGLAPLRQVLTGGDVLSASHMRRVLEALPGIHLVAAYGPTEGTTFTTCFSIPEPRQAATPFGTVPIGRPIANARVHVLDREMRPVPPGTAGELYVGGDGLARGYLGRPDLTAERFVPDPFAELAGERLYRTGDLVRYLPGGLLDFLGRLDDQVKIRGFRVEPGEVEALLSHHPEVRQAAVLVRPEAGGGKALVACVVPALPSGPADGSGEDLTARLQRFLRDRLPEPMVPSAWLALEALPLTPNGKVDRRALASRVTAAGAAGGRPPYVAPRTPLEERLVAACAEVLAVKGGPSPGPVGVHDNFFDLGGHSLLATQWAARLRDRWGIEVPLQMLFEAAHFSELAERITERELIAADHQELRELLSDLDGLSSAELQGMLGTGGPGGERE